MALINCPECGKEISEHASQCPSCGSPIENYNYSIEITELNQTDQFSYDKVAKIMGKWAIRDDAMNKLQKMPCMLVVKDNKADTNNAVNNLKQMGFTCLVNMKNMIEAPKPAKINYITPELLNILSTAIIIGGIIIGIIIWTIGSFTSRDVAGSGIALLNGLSTILVAIGTGIIFKFMAEVLNRLSK